MLGMSKHRVAVLKVVSGQLSVTAAAAECRISRRHLHRLLRRYREDGLDGLEPRSRRPRTSPHGDARRGARADRRPPDRSSPPGASTPGPPPSPGTSGARACRSRRPRPSGGSSTPRASSCPSRTSARAAPGAASRRRRPTRSGSRTSPTGASPTAARSRSARWLDDHSRYLLGLHRVPPGRRRRRGRDLHRGGRRSRLARRHAHRQRDGLHGALHRGPQRPRAPARLPRHPPEERRAGPPPDPGQDRALPPDPEALARAAARGARTSRGSRPSSTPSALVYNEQRPHRAIGRRTPGEAYRAIPKDQPSGPGGRGHFRLRYDTTDSKGAMTLRRGRPPAPPQGRRGACPPAGPRHRRRAGGHGRRPRHRRDPLDPPHRARQGLLAQHTTRPRPMAGVSSDRLITGVAYVATHVSPMSRLKTVVGGEGLEPPTSSV